MQNNIQLYSLKFKCVQCGSNELLMTTLGNLVHISQVITIGKDKFGLYVDDADFIDDYSEVEETIYECSKCKETYYLESLEELGMLKKVEQNGVN